MPAQSQLLPLTGLETPPVAVSSKNIVRGIRELRGLELHRAKGTLKVHHYTRVLPSGKSYWLAFEAAIIVWSIPANSNIGLFLLGKPCRVWELSRLWAPDGHAKNLLSQAISAASKWIIKAERPDVLVSYADPNAGHSGGVYRAASWLYNGQTDDGRTYVREDGARLARRSFHSGPSHLTKAEIEARGFVEMNLPGKYRFVKPLSKEAKRLLKAASLRPGRVST